jgi:hypothetical protein
MNEINRFHGFKKQQFLGSICSYWQTTETHTTTQHIRLSSCKTINIHKETKKPMKRQNCYSSIQQNIPFLLRYKLASLFFIVENPTSVIHLASQMTTTCYRYTQSSWQFFSSVSFPFTQNFGNWNSKLIPHCWATILIRYINQISISITITHSSNIMEKRTAAARDSVLNRIMKHILVRIFFRLRLSS